MGILNIFEDFKETIFIKSDSNLENEISELEKIKNDSNKDKINYEIKLLKLGLYGENQIRYELKNANIGMYILHDVTIEYEGQKAQIDWIIITKAYTYFVECKNLIGSITVNNNGEFRREYTINNKVYKEAIYSPYTQAVRHKEIYEKIWKSENNSFLDKTLRKDAVSRWIKPLVVLSNPKSLLNIHYAPKEIKATTIRADNLVSYLKKDIATLNKDYYLSKKKMEEQANAWLRRNIPSSTYISDKYKNVSKETKTSAINEQLKSKLERFRKDRSKSMNIPAYYVFTNEELNLIITYLPQGIDELKKYLPEIKIKVHGIEIIKIIKECLSNN